MWPFKKKAPPPNWIQALPISLHPTAKEKLLRHVGRLERLLAAKLDTEEWKDEVRKRKGALMSAGIDAPDTAQAAKMLYVKLTQET